MPELPEVEHLARGLETRILGAAIGDVRCHFAASLEPDPRCFIDAVRGRTFEKLHRHGKYLFFLLERNGALALHLRMTGQLLLVPETQAADKHTHVEFLLAGRDTKLVFRDVRKFGRLRLLDGSPEQFIREKKLGDDALKISARRLKKLLGKTSRTIKAALLDQRVIAGLGNIYTDEILFREAISPLRRAASLDPEQVASLRRTIRAVLQAAIRRNGTTISDYVDDQGHSGSYQGSLLVYSRTGLPCKRCGTPIVRIQVAGRSTHVCPVCQAL